MMSVVDPRVPVLRKALADLRQVNGASQQEPPEWMDDEPAPKPEPIKLYTCAEMSEPLPELDYFVEEIGLNADTGAPHLVVGYGFSGKTVALQSMALSLVSHKPVWGAYTSRYQRRVVHVDLEQGKRLTFRRYQRLALGMGLDLATTEGLHCAIMPTIKLTSEYRSEWRDLMHGRDLIIIDSLGVASEGIDENSAVIRSCLDMLGPLTEETKCKGIVVHHTRKASPDGVDDAKYAVRGSGAIYAAADGIWVLSGLKGEPTLVTHVRAREHGTLVDDVSLEIVDVAAGMYPKAGLAVNLRNAEEVRATKQRMAEVAASDRIGRDADVLFDLVSGHEGYGTEDGKARTGLNGKTFTNARNHLLAKGRIHLRRNDVTRVVGMFLGPEQPSGPAAPKTKSKR